MQLCVSNLRISKSEKKCFQQTFVIYLYIDAFKYHLKSNNNEANITNLNIASLQVDEFASLFFHIFCKPWIL